MHQRLKTHLRPPFLSSPCKSFSLILASLVVDNMSLGCAHMCCRSFKVWWWWFIIHVVDGSHDGGFSWAVWPICVMVEGEGKGGRHLENQIIVIKKKNISIKK